MSDPLLSLPRPVGIDAWGGQPVAESELCRLIDAGENNLDRIPWS